MPEDVNTIVTALHEIRDLLLLIAEPEIAKRDQKLRTELRKIVGKSPVAAKSALLMDGSNTQRQIREKTQMHQGNLSTLVKKLHATGLVIGDVKQPKLIISIPTNFFESDTEA